MLSCDLLYVYIQNYHFWDVWKYIIIELSKKILIFGMMSMSYGCDIKNINPLRKNIL